MNVDDSNDRIKNRNTNKYFFMMVMSKIYGGIGVASKNNDNNIMILVVKTNKKTKIKRKTPSSSILVGAVVTFWTKDGVDNGGCVNHYRSNNSDENTSVTLEDNEDL